MNAPDSKSKATEEIKRERDAALVAVQQTKLFFEEAVKQTERFWGHFRWIAGVLVTIIVLAVGFQAYQNNARLTDAVNTATSSMNTFLASAEDRIRQVEKKASDDVDAAIEKLYKAKVDSVIVKNSKDDSKVLTAYLKHSVQVLNNVPLSVKIEFYFRVRVGYEGSGTTEISGVEIQSDSELVDSIYKDYVESTPDILKAGTIIMANGFTAVPSRLYAFDFNFDRELSSCDEYDKLVKQLRERGTIGNIFVSPIIRDLPAAPKFEFAVSVVERTMMPCKDMWNFARTEREKTNQ